MPAFIFVFAAFLAATVMGSPTPQTGLTTAPVATLTQALPVDGLLGLLGTTVTHTSLPTQQLTSPLGLTPAQQVAPSPLGLPSSPLGLPSSPLGLPSSPLGLPNSPLL